MKTLDENPELKFEYFMNEAALHHKQREEDLEKERIRNEELANIRRIAMDHKDEEREVWHEQEEIRRLEAKEADIKIFDSVMEAIEIVSPAIATGIKLTKAITDKF